MTYVVSEESMQIEQSWYEVMNIRYGYVSHSFNQFLIAEDGKLYRLDHGDAYPRGAVISKCDQSDISSCGYQIIWPIQGETGNNTTGVSVGGFEKAGKYLVTVGNSCTQESKEAWDADKTRNIFLTSTNADTIKSKMDDWNDSDTEEVPEEEPTKKIWLTNYTADDAVSVKTPYLVKASDNLLYVMWEEENAKKKNSTVKIVGVDAQGNQVTDMAGIYGRLSDCKPIYESDGMIQWYTSSAVKADGYYEWDDDGNFSYVDHAEETEVLFYKVDTRKLSEYQFTEKFDFSKVEVSLERTEFVYDPEKECTPKVVAVYEGAYLEEGRDFEVYYENNQKPGQAEVTLKGKGCFSGSKSLHFTIRPRQSQIPAKVENGSQKVTAIKTGTRYKDSATKSWYQITKASKGKYEAAYLRPVSKNTTTIKIPATIKIKGKSIPITSVAKNACAGCKKVTKVSIGSNVTKIGSKAFYQCSQLKSITIPKKVTRIDDKAFAKDRKLVSITIKTTKLTEKSFGSSAFADINGNAKFTVPKAKKKSYEKILRKTGIKKKVKIADGNTYKYER